MYKYIVGFGYESNEYTVNGVKYTVESKFVPTDFKNMNNNTTMDNCFEKYLKSDFADLPSVESGGKITAEDVCSAAGKEDKYAVEE